MEKWYNLLKVMFITMFAMTAAYLDNTVYFLYAMLLGFALNIIAGFRADEVSIKMTRIFPPKFFLKNYQGNKFKDSLMELFLTISITYVFKQIIDFFDGEEEKSIYVVQLFFAIQTWFFGKNALRNFVEAYPKYVFLRVIYYLVSFNFKELFGITVSNIIEKSEKEVRENKGLDETNKQTEKQETNENKQ